MIKVCPVSSIETTSTSPTSSRHDAEVIEKWKVLSLAEFCSRTTKTKNINIEKVGLEA